MQTNNTTAAIKVEPMIPERSNVKPRNLKTNDCSNSSWPPFSCPYYRTLIQY